MRNAFVLGTLVVWLASGSRLIAQADVTPFGRDIREDNAVGIQWPEMRRVVRVEISFPAGAKIPQADAMKLEYWRHVWQGEALRRYGDFGAGGVGWAAMDDWYSGEWKRAAAKARIEGRTAVFTFTSSTEEYPQLKTEGVLYRPTLKVRVLFPGAPPKAASIRAFTDSTWRSADLKIRFEARQTCDDPLEVYNGRVVTKRAALGEGGCSLRATVSYLFNPDDREADRTIVTVRSPKDPFSFAVDEAERGDRIFIKDFGVLVTRAADPVTIAEYRRILTESGAKSLYDRVSEESEQTLSRAWKDMPLKVPYYFILGCEGGRQRFRLNPDGGIQMHWPSHPQRKDPSSPLWQWPDYVTYRFGLPGDRFSERTIAEGYLPIVTTRWTSGDLVYEQEAFAGLLAANLNSAPPIQADEPTVAFLKIRLVNAAAAARRAELKFTSEVINPDKKEPVPQPLTFKDDLVLSGYQGGESVRYLVDRRGAGSLSSAAGAVVYSVELGPHQEHTIWVKAPFVTPAGDGDIGKLRALEPERER
ncbi:MAG TPA: hypothetical protein VHA11_04345, partial [Bryobacteraceae bacterium]|nr:hypothetical protein [Bryobacteraceae bacterium]